MDNAWDTLRLFTSAFLFLFVLGSVQCNAYILFLRWYLRRQPGSSILVVGGVAGALALWLSPFEGLRRYWWIPLFVDLHCAPLLVCLAYGVCTGKYPPKQPPGETADRANHQRI